MSITDREPSQEEKSRCVDFGARLRDERRRLGFTGKALADALGISQSLQSMIENGHRVADLVYIYRCADLGMDLTFLVAGPPAAREKITAGEHRLGEAQRGFMMDLSALSPGAQKAMAALAKELKKGGD